MLKIMTLMMRLEKLKRTARAGWNIEFPPNYRFKTRNIHRAESVADHSWSLVMLALALAYELKLDALKIVWMAAIHDIAELETLDIVTATLEPGEKQRIENEKKRLEDAAMRDIFLPMGDWGRYSYELWLEYENQTSAEARVLKQLDKLEVCIQALAYREHGEEISPEEFFDHADAFMKTPEIISILSLLRERAVS